MYNLQKDAPKNIKAGDRVIIHPEPTQIKQWGKKYMGFVGEVLYYDRGIGDKFKVIDKAGNYYNFPRSWVKLLETDGE